MSISDDRLMICTGWCAHLEGHNNKARSALQNESLYLGSVWLPAILHQVEPKAVMVYNSLCDIPAAAGLLRSDIVNMVYAPRPARELPYRHDWAAAIMVAAGYAMANNLDLMFIEQDCLVYRLKDFLDFARISNHSICYGYGEGASLYNNWAANSLIYCSWSLLDEFMTALAQTKDISDGEVKLEERFHDRVMSVGAGEYFRPWPWGVDRLRPLPQGDDPFYAQQLTDGELDYMTAKIMEGQND
ncbi:MAG TPA: hypothetical protein PLH32_17715 [bacterium]|nr:hypothetical protein [bacterium]